jgi:GTP cyclohydrolase II
MDNGGTGKRRHIILTSHPGAIGSQAVPIRWGAASALERGPIVATTANPAHRNAIGTHAGSYGVYRALAIAARQLHPLHRPDLTDTAPAEPIGPHPQWINPQKIVSLDPWGHMVGEAFADLLKEGCDIRPTIAVTKAHINMPEFRDAMAAKRLRADGEILLPNGDVRVTKVAIEPVWFLPGIAQRFGISETDLRRSLFEHCGGIFPELVTRPDLSVFLPPIGGATVYLIGSPSAIAAPDRPVACRVHDECNGSDVFGSDICTCRPYLAHGIEVCIQTAQEGGCGIIVYNRKEGRALGEVTKFLVYNARKRQTGGDRAETYFERTECVAGVQDMRFQQLMPDVLHWLGVSRIDRFVSMSDLKFGPLVESGIRVVQRVEIPEGLIPADARVEMDAKKAAGYFTERPPSKSDLLAPKGRGLTE